MKSQLKDLIVERDAQQLPPKIGQVVANSRASFPLSFLHANNYVTTRIALIG